ncbi:polysaccharide biosynthesis protein [Tatlockia micdadei]|uniref:polysaccharide biosynthesis protein n=1 Tax=Legionella micdadei TaxID=451 RepID=UPI001570ABAF|nr:nucleoside-diphosphate sugar epimerase/dehydratase [Legionella micdadei]NSL19143.1 polysaccharide biosynthesis protein [Legionella micdadei]
MQNAHFSFKFNKKIAVIAFDILAIPLAWYCAYWLRFNMQPFPSGLATAYSLSALGILAVVQIVCYCYFKVYRGLWRFSSLNDVARIIKATLCATVLTIPALYLTTILHHIPRSVPLLYAMMVIVLLCSARLIRRSLWEYRDKRGESNDIKRVLIIGAGRAGESLVRDLKRTQSYLPVGLVDDNINKRGLEVHGVRVLGQIRDLRELVIQYRVDLIFIAIPSARSALMRRIVDHCEACNVPFRTLPSLSALAAGRVEVNALRDVNIEDLLGRDQVQLQWDKIAANIKGRRVIVTGGGGSIGSELCRQIMTLNPSTLLVIDNSEFNLYKIEGELRSKFPQIPLELQLISVTDKVAVDYVFNRFKPQIVFHAAAYKHVPMLEEQIRAAVQNNVLGTQIIAEASVAEGVEKFILISTDKAVNPTNVMGTTKRVAEIYCQNLNRLTETQFITVRFGNVLGSAGSVVPLFKKQLQAGGPLTVTHPDIQRYFMTIPEASQLILQAMVNGQGGEIFVLDMGEPIKIRYLAEQMIRLAGKEPGKDIGIEYTGLRPGEKLYEELFHISEELAPTEHEKLFKAKFRQLEWSELIQAMRLLNIACTLHNDKELYILLKNLVPEFSTQPEEIV